MKLEDQCISLPLAKRLKELGVKQESLFVWMFDDSPLFEHEMSIQKRGDNPADESDISAFTVAELYSLICEADPHYTFPAGIEPDQLADFIAEELERKLIPTESR